MMSTLDARRVCSSDKPMAGRQLGCQSSFRSKTPAHGVFRNEDDVTSRWTVGPGAYEATSFFSADKLPINGHQSSFRSCRRPFVMGPPKTPGPGAYTAKGHSGGWGSRSSKQHMTSPAPSARSPSASSSSSSAFVWTRRATAPSIPSIDTAMGYEEDADGHLVPQDAPRPPKGGVAPSSYSPLSTLTKPRGAINGAWGLAEREGGSTFGIFAGTTAAAALAPGHSIGMTANPRPRRAVPYSSFVPKVEPAKSGWKPWAGAPGVPASRTRDSRHHSHSRHARIPSHAKGYRSRALPMRKPG